MTNGNNNGHHSNGTNNGLVHPNGNGHKPDAAIVTEHELLWDGLAPAVTQALGQPLDPRWSPSARGAAAGSSTTSKATSSSTRPTESSDTAAGAWS